MDRNLRRWALISVSDKSGLVDLAKELENIGISDGENHPLDQKK